MLLFSVQSVPHRFSFFFFSSRRRHTRLQGDWSSDVCSSDLAKKNGETVRKEAIAIRSDGKYLDVNLEVVPLKTNRAQPSFLVAFEEALPKAAASVARGRDRGEKSKKERRTEDLKLLRLQQELS